MANKFTKSVLERQYLEKQRMGSAHRQDGQATQEQEGPETSNPQVQPAGKTEHEIRSESEPQATPQRRSSVFPQEREQSDSDGGRGSRASALGGQAAQERGGPETSHPQGAAQDAVPAYIIPEPEGRTPTAETPAAGIDEAFERADSGYAPASSQDSRAEKDGAANLEAGSVPSAEPAQPAEKGEETPGMGKPLSDLVESYLIRTPERVAKNKTFYLDEAVIAGIRASAKKQKVTESKLVNDILRGVLGVR